MYNANHLTLSFTPSFLPPNMFHIVSLNRVDSGNAVTLACLSKIPGWGLAQCDGGSADPGSWASLCRVSSSWENRCPRRLFLQVICRMVCSLLLLCNAILLQIRCNCTTGSFKRLWKLCYTHKSLQIFFVARGVRILYWCVCARLKSRRPLHILKIPISVLGESGELQEHFSEAEEIRDVLWIPPSFSTPANQSQSSVCCCQTSEVLLAGELDRAVL